jgi:hypothetical protein
MMAAVRLLLMPMVVLGASCSDPVQGTYTLKNDPIDWINASSFEDCCDKCSNEAKCNYFEFHTELVGCRLYEYVSGPPEEGRCDNQCQDCCIAGRNLSPAPTPPTPPVPTNYTAIYTEYAHGSGCSGSGTETEYTTGQCGGSEYGPSVGSVYAQWSCVGGYCNENYFFFSNCTGDTIFPETCLKNGQCYPGPGSSSRSLDYKCSCVPKAV